MDPDGPDRGGVTNNHHEVAPAPDLHCEHAGAVLGSVEGATLVSSNCRVSVRLGPHHRTLVMRHVEGAYDVTDAFSTILSSFKRPPAQAHQVARRPLEAGSRDDPRATGGTHQRSSRRTDRGAAEGARVSSAVRSLRACLRVCRFRRNSSRHTDLCGYSPQESRNGPLHSWTWSRTAHG